VTDSTNWALVIGGGIITGLLILAIITGLYLLLNNPPAAEPPERPAGLLALGREGMLWINNELEARPYSPMAAWWSPSGA